MCKSGNNTFPFELTIPHSLNNWIPGKPFRALSIAAIRWESSRSAVDNHWKHPFRSLRSTKEEIRFPFSSWPKHHSVIQTVYYSYVKIKGKWEVKLEMAQKMKPLELFHLKWYYSYSSSLSNDKNESSSRTLKSNCNTNSLPSNRDFMQTLLSTILPLNNRIKHSKGLTMVVYSIRTH